MNTHQQRRRDPHPEDKDLFSSSHLVHLRSAVLELSWLLSKGYALHSTLELVGNHYQLTQRQRLAVSRVVCSDENRQLRQEKCLPLEKIKDEQLLIDGFNLLITIETALSGGIVLRCRDGCIRDIAGIHGSYHPINETRQAIELIGMALESFNPQEVLWLFDKPISNSGRLVMMVRDIAKEHGWHWQADVNINPDKAILSANKIAITSDSMILDGINQWVNLGSYLVLTILHSEWLIDFAKE